MAPHPEELEERGRDGAEPLREVVVEQVVEASPEANRAVGELLREAPVLVGRPDPPGGVGEGEVEAAPPTDGKEGVEGDPAPRRERIAQSSIPRVGEEGTAMARGSIRPASHARRPARTACFIARAIATGASA